MSYSSEVLADSPLGYWRMGEASGTTLVDSSGGSHDGTYVVAPTLGVTGALTGDSDTAADFQGPTTGAHATIATGTWMDAAAITVEAWIKRESSSNSGYIISRDANSGVTRDFRLFINNVTGRLDFAVWNTGGTVVTLNPTTVLAQDTWYHVVGTYDGANMRLYVDGSQVDSVAHTGNVRTTAQKICIGSFNESTSNRFSGVLDEVAYYGTALSAARVLAHYDAGTGTVSPTTIVGTRATETDVTQAGVASVGALIVGGLALEVDEAIPSIGSVVVLGGRAVEVDEARTGTVGTVILGHLAQELNSGGGGSVHIMPPVTPAPVLAMGHRVVVAQAFGPVTMQGSQPVYSISQAATERARQRIVVDGIDVTYFRDSITPNVTYTLLEPLLYGPATLELPQVSACFERLGVGALSWLRPGAEVVVQRVIDDVVVGTDWKGVIVAFDTSGRNLSVELGGEASGRAALRNRQVPIFPRVNDLGRQFADSIRDLGLSFDPPLGPVTGIEAMTTGGTGHLEHIQNLVAKAWTRAGKHWTIMPDELTGAYGAHRKDDETIHGTVFLNDSKTVANLRRDISEEPNRIYATGVTPKGRRVRFGVYPGLIQGPTPDFPGHMELGSTGDGVRLLIGKLHAMGYLKLTDAAGGYDQDVYDAVVDLQIDAGLFDEGFVGTAVPGEVNLTTWNALYDLGVTDNSLEWANIQPAAQRRKVRPWNRSASGGIMGVNPLYDPNHLVRDRNVDLGTGMNRSQMREFSRTVLHDSDDANWVGDITFRTGALVRGEGSEGMVLAEADVMDARELRPGMNLWLPQFDGGTFVHVSAIQVDGSGTVTATVDTRFRDAMEVWEVIARNKESRRDPARQRNQKHRSSTIVKDSIGEWDEIGGLLGNDVPLEAGWNVFEVIGAMEGTIAKLRLMVGDASTVVVTGDGDETLIENLDGQEFACAVFGRSITADRLNNLIPAPLTVAGTKMWETKRGELNERWILYSAGTHDEPCGYSPGRKHFKSVQAEEPNPDYDPETDPDSERVITVTTEESWGNITGKHVDEAGFAYRSESRTVLHVAVWVRNEATLLGGRIMWPQLEAGA